MQVQLEARNKSLAKLPVCEDEGATQVPLEVKSPPVNAGDIRDYGLIPGSGRCFGEEHGNPCQYSCLENPMDRGAWMVTVYRVTKSWTQLKQLSTHTHTHTRTHTGPISQWDTTGCQSGTFTSGFSDSAQSASAPPTSLQPFLKCSYTLDYREYIKIRLEYTDVYSLKLNYEAEISFPSTRVPSPLLQSEVSL